MMEGPTITALLRGLHLAAALSLFGTAGFIVWTLPAAGQVPATLHRSLIRLGCISGLIALLAGVAWFVRQAATIADAATLADVLDAIPVVAAHTRFGNFLLLRLGLLLAATILLWRAGPRTSRGIAIALVLAGAALGLQGLVGHTGAIADATGQGLVLSEALHLLAAGVWLGALAPLGLALWSLPPGQAALACQRFSPIGLGCVLVLAGTGLTQALPLIGGVPALFGTPYGRIAMIKIALFLIALALAAANRLFLTDRLATTPAARGHLLWSVGAELAAGCGIVFAAGVLASTLPGAHDTPVWPLSWKFSLLTLTEDPELKSEVEISLLAIGGATILWLAALVRGRFRLSAFAVLATTLFLCGRSLSLLTVEAYPTSFQTSPTGFAAASIVRGEALYGPYCAACHGAAGRGDGPAAAGLRIKPADLTMPHLREHADGDLFWWLSHGIDDPGNAHAPQAMPGFADALSAEDRWALIDYVRAHNAGVAMNPSGNAAVKQPAFAITCHGLAADRTGDLRGNSVRIVTSSDVLVGRLSIITVSLTTDRHSETASGTCDAADPSAWRAFAVLADLPPDRLAGTVFLIDPAGWLRAVQRPDQDGPLRTPLGLMATEGYLRANPVQPAYGGAHDHHP